ncbi:MAG: chemotaxis protein CheA [Herpetosiphonaceae bacterium]|nr:MAG: chemotaxis protein CheA [Herpetosiphonaceae bacterium]
MSVPDARTDNVYFAEFLDDFFAECDEHLTRVHRSLLALQRLTSQEQPNRSILDELFRSFHSLKGLSGMVGLKESEELVHEMESYLRALRQGQATFSSAALDALVSAVHLLEQVLNARRIGQPSPDTTSMLKWLQNLTPTPLPQAPPNLQPIEPTIVGRPVVLNAEEQERLEEALRRGAQAWRFIFIPTSELVEQGISVASIRARLEQIGNIIRIEPRVAPHGTVAFEFIVASDSEETLFAPWSGDGLRYGPYAPDTTSNSPPLTDEPSAPSTDIPNHSFALSNVVRVDLARLDHVMSLVGELMISRARLNDTLARHESDIPASQQHTLFDLNHAMERQLRDLREGVMRTRLVPIGTIFERMQFVIRDLAQDSGKQIVLDLSGQETEIDKFIVERMLDPLLHLVRNAVSHGIETSAERAALGKPKIGTIALHASASGDAVIIEVEDDGAGVDPEAIAARARAQGLLRPDQSLVAGDILDIICTPGFSMRVEADRTSGRGVGMAAVKSTIQELGGTLMLDTRPGLGSRFTIQLPLTLAIINALIVGVADQIFAVPLPAIREVIEVEREAVSVVERHELIAYRGTALPLLRLAHFFNLSETGQEGRYALVIGSGAGAVGLVVGRIAGRQEIIVRAMNDPLVRVPGLSGATELGDGAPVLILNTAELVHSARQQPRYERRLPAPAMPTPPIFAGSTVQLRRSTMPDTGHETEPFILFEIAGTTYGVPSRAVQQMEMVERITAVPNAPPCIDGIVFSLGHVIPVVNLRRRFGFERIPSDRRSRLIVVRSGERRVGLLADTAREFVSISPESIHPPPDSIAGHERNCLKGTALLGERLILILNIDEVLDGAETILTPAA